MIETRWKQIFCTKNCSTFACWVFSKKKNIVSGQFQARVFRFLLWWKSRKTRNTNFEPQMQSNGNKTENFFSELRSNQTPRWPNRHRNLYTTENNLLDYYFTQIKKCVVSLQNYFGVKSKSFCANRNSTQKNLCVRISQFWFGIPCFKQRNPVLFRVTMNLFMEAVQTHPKIFVELFPLHEFETEVTKLLNNENFAPAFNLTIYLLG